MKSISRVYCLLVLIGLTLLWAYWPTFERMIAFWNHDPQYSHGYLVPLIACLIAWKRTVPHALDRMNGSVWGLVLIGLAVSLRLAGAYYYYIWYEMISLIPMLAGIVLAVGGWGTLLMLWPGIVFLIFMIPLPYSLGMFLAPMLQHWATVASTYWLQTIGVPAVSEGNIILLTTGRIGVVEACGGLSMLVVFLALSVALAFFSKRSLLLRLLAVASAVPIALVCNIFRITMTGVVHELLGEASANLFHDWSGWLMIPIAFAIHHAEWLVIDRLYYVNKPDHVSPLDLAVTG